MAELNWQLLWPSHVHRGERTAELLLYFDRRVIVIYHLEVLLLLLAAI